MNYNFLKAQMAFGMVDLPPAPTPLYALTIPYDLWQAWRWWRGDRVLLAAKKGGAAQEKDGVSQEGFLASGLKWVEIGTERPSEGEDLNPKSPGKLESALKEKTEFTLAEWEAFGIKHVRMDHFINSYGRYYRPAERITKEQIDALAKAIAEYITANQDEVAQEENWRTKMQKEIARRFKQLQEANAAQSKQIAAQSEQIAAQSKQIASQSEKITNLEEQNVEVVAMLKQVLAQTARV